MSNENGGLKDKQALIQALKSIKELVELLSLLTTHDELTKIAGEIKGIGQPKQDLKVALENLEQIVTNRINPKTQQKQYLLHRLVDNFERKDAPNIHETTQNTDWVAEGGVAELQQDRSEATLKGANPVVSCWIPEASISDIVNGQNNTGTWGDLGQNPNKNHFRIVVKPGKYEIYGELAQ
jgi:hypothetical protein